MVSTPLAWSEFDRYSPIPAAERVIRTVRDCGLEYASHDIPFPLGAGMVQSARCRLHEAGWDGSTRLAVFNPAGLFATRNWPLEHYVELYRLWSEREPVTVLVLGTERVLERGEAIARRSGGRVINLAGQTTPGEAIALLRCSDIIVTEDSGLMHMAWAAGLPVVAMLGSTRSDWSAPGGERAVVFDSSDLECGCCMEPECRLGDVRCLVRRTPAEVLDAALGLLARLQMHTRKAAI